MTPAIRNATAGRHGTNARIKMLNKNSSSALSMRSLGESLTDKGFFELDLGSGRVLWLNEFVLSTVGMDLIQAQSLTIYAVVPEEFHDALSGFIADATRGRTSKFYIWPHQTASGEIAWWYFSGVKSEQPIHWFKAEFLNRTKKSGPEFASMCAAMNTANSYNDLFNRLADFQELTKDSMDILNRHYTELKDEQAELREHIAGAVSAATKAANAAMEVSFSMRTFRTDVQEQLAGQTTEILKLIGTDVVHDQRLAAFEEHMRKATDTAVAAITTQADKAGVAITSQAKKAGDGLSRRITIPIGAIAAIMTIIQWLISHWPR